MDFEKLISERYSVRSFRSEHLPQAVIDKILHAGYKAPTGCNYQPQRIVVMNTDDSIARLQKCTKCHFNAPSAMLVCHNREESWVRKYDGALSSSVDAVIVTTYMMLAAQNEGVGTCWVMHFDPAAMREAFNIPDHVEPIALLVMGYPSDDARPLDLHFQSRPMDETVVYEGFR
ncbi:MAG: nitroreductase family protein [Clostridia bacterium]|nr:nitroreductase family protein [Clostridia bacterium]MBQ9785714.1 nitroreductase family protein [Clostridia bacterium]